MLLEKKNYKSEDYDTLYEAIKNDNFNFKKYTSYNEESAKSSCFLGDLIFSKLDNEKAMNLLKLCISKGQNINGISKKSDTLSICYNPAFLFNNYDEIKKMGLIVEENTKNKYFFFSIFQSINRLLTLSEFNRDGIDLDYNTIYSVIKKINFAEMERELSIDDELNNEMSYFLFGIIKYKKYTQEEKDKLLEVMLEKGLNPNRIYINYNDKIDCFYNHIKNFNSFKLLKNYGCEINEGNFIIKFLTENFNSKNENITLKEKFAILEKNLDLFKSSTIEEIIQKLNINNERLKKEDIFNQNNYGVFYNNNKQISFVKYFIESHISSSRINNYSVQKEQIFKQDLKYLKSLGFNFSNLEEIEEYLFNPITIKTLITEDIDVNYKEIFINVNRFIINKHTPSVLKNSIPKNYTIINFIYDSGIYDAIQQKNKKLSDYVDIDTLLNPDCINKKMYINILNENYDLEPHLNELIKSIQSKELFNFLYNIYPDKLTNEFLNKHESIDEEELCYLRNEVKINIFKKLNFENQDQFNKLFKNMSRKPLSSLKADSKYKFSFIKTLFQNKNKEYIINYFKNHYKDFANNSNVDYGYEFLNLLNKHNIETSLDEDKYLIKVDDYDFNDNESIKKFKEKYKEKYKEINNTSYSTDIFSKHFLFNRFYTTLTRKRNDLTINQSMFEYNNIDYVVTLLFDKYNIKNKRTVLDRLNLNELNEKNVNNVDKMGYNVFDYIFSILSLYFNIRDDNTYYFRHIRLFNNKESSAQSFAFNYILINFAHLLSEYGFIFSDKMVDYFKNQMKNMSKYFFKEFKKNLQEYLPIDNIISIMEKHTLTSRYMIKDNSKSNKICKSTI